MRLAPAATFPTGRNDDGEATVDQAFWIGETPVTYEPWYKVYTLATHSDRGAGKYSFASAGREGSHGATGETPTAAKLEPVTTVS